MYYKFKVEKEMSNWVLVTVLCAYASVKVRLDEILVALSHCFDAAIHCRN